MCELSSLVNMVRYPLHSASFAAQCREALDQKGVLVLANFLVDDVIETIRQEGEAERHLAYYTADRHNVYLKPTDSDLPADHPRNREVTSSKGCITTDRISASSPLHRLYNDAQFRSFLCRVLGEEKLYEYADPLSSINLHYADEGQELGWHFDNSSFAITLLIQKPDEGGIFEYVKDVENPDLEKKNYDLVDAILNNQIPTETLNMGEGTLVLFRGRNALHRVTRVKGNATRMLVVLAYNTEPNISLSESARMTFYGRLN